MVNLGIRLHTEHVKWSPESEVKNALVCRQQGGVPMYLSKFAGIPFEVEGGRAFMMKCWAGTGPEVTKVFTNVPEKEIKDVEEKIGDWHRRMKRFDPIAYGKAKKYGIVIPGYRLPKIP